MDILGVALILWLHFGENGRGGPGGSDHWSGTNNRPGALNRSLRYARSGQFEYFVVVIIVCVVSIRGSQVLQIPYRFNF